MSDEINFPTPRLVDNTVTTDLHGAEKYTGADVIVDQLAVIGAGYVFGLQGGAIEPLFDAVARRRRKGGFRLDGEHSPQARSRDTLYFGPQPVFSRHEAGAAFMADGYYRETGRLGVCCSTSGPGATNLITGVSSAYADNIPMLVITPQTALDRLGSGSLQEATSESIDTVSMFSHCTRYNSFVSHPEQLGPKLSAAILRAFQHPMGPVHLSIPREILAEERIEHSIIDIGPKLRVKKFYDETAVKALADDLSALSRAGKKIVCIVGQDCAEAAPHIEKLAERTGCAFLCAAPGKQHINAFHPLFKGVFGFSGHASARKALLDAQVERVLFIGGPLNEITSGGWDPALVNNKLVHIAVNPEHLGQTSTARFHVEGHLETVMKALLNQLDWADGTRSVYLESAAANAQTEQRFTGLPQQLKYDNSMNLAVCDGPVQPQALMVALSESLPANTLYFVEAGNAWPWALHYLHTSTPGAVKASMGYASMCWAISAAVGTKLGKPDLPVVCISGDGAWLMSGQEITVAVQRRMPLIYLILNDGAYGMVRHGQQSGKAEEIGWELPAIDYAAMAEAVGARGVNVQNYSDLQALDYTAYLAGERPTVIDIEIDIDAIAPMAERLRVLHGNP